MEKEFVAHFSSRCEASVIGVKHQQENIFLFTNVSQSWGERTKPKESWFHGAFGILMINALLSLFAAISPNINHRQMRSTGSQAGTCVDAMWGDLWVNARKIWSNSQCREKLCWSENGFLLLSVCHVQVKRRHENEFFSGLHKPIKWIWVNLTTSCWMFMIGRWIEHLSLNRRFYGLIHDMWRWLRVIKGIAHQRPPLPR
jgi:hypothetical protein